MATAVNPSTSAGISIGSAVAAVTGWLRQITVRIVRATPTAPGWCGFSED
jgi:hypothetical protein